MREQYQEELNELLRCAAGKDSQDKMSGRIRASDYMNQRRGPVYEHFRNRLLEAARKSRKELVKTLIAQGADMNAADKDGLTPLAYAAWAGAEGVAETLLDRGLSVDEPGVNGKTPLMVTACRGDIGFPRLLETAEFLLDRGASLDARDDAGKTALMYAVENRSPLAELLVQRGADVKLAELDGWTALMYAAMKGWTVMARTLLAAGAEVDAADTDGRTALTVAAVNDRMGAVRELRRAGADIRKAAAPLWKKKGRDEARGFALLYRLTPKFDKKKIAPLCREALNGLARAKNGDAEYDVLKKALEKAVAIKTKIE